MGYEDTKAANDAAQAELAAVKASIEKLRQFHHEHYIAPAKIALEKATRDASGDVERQFGEPLRKALSRAWDAERALERAEIERGRSDPRIGHSFELWRWTPVGRDAATHKAIYDWQKTSARAVGAAYDGTNLNASLKAWKKPRLGAFIVLLLKADGKPGKTHAFPATAADLRTKNGLWLPEGKRPSDLAADHDPDRR